MRKRNRKVGKGVDDLRPEYRFDYAASRPNPYAKALSGRQIAVVLDADVAAAFPTSESVNTALRATLRAVRRRSSPPSRNRTARSGTRTRAKTSRRGSRR